MGTEIISLQLRLWLKVSEAITNDDQKAATEEKSKLENEQRTRAKSEICHKPKWFKQDLLSKNYEYIHAELVLFIKFFLTISMFLLFISSMSSITMILKHYMSTAVERSGS